VTGVTTYGEMHVRAGRYLGVAPLPGGYTNSCVVTADRAALKTRDLLLATLRSDPVTADRFASARIVAGPSVLGPLALDVRVAGAPGLLLAGDAAGFIDPMTGDGLRFAFRGGELAAEEALRVLAEGWQEAHVRLDRARRREFVAKWRFNRALRHLVTSPLTVRAAAAGARVAPSILQQVIRYAGDIAIA
jgi:flavin-dependent dehydrogenase